ACHSLGGTVRRRRWAGGGPAGGRLGGCPRSAVIARSPARVYYEASGRVKKRRTPLSRFPWGEREGAFRHARVGVHGEDAQGRVRARGRTGLSDRLAQAGAAD